MKKIVKALLPPLLLQGIKKLRAGRSHGSERSADWYDRTFESVGEWRLHYSESPYYFLWTVIVDRLLRANARRVLDIGCGPGQLACLLRDRGIAEYHGFDFSPKRVEQAQKVCPEYRFTIEDAFATDLFTTFVYDSVVCTEFLEHVERDLEVLQRIASGTRVLATVPNFPGGAHVRYFRDADEVHARYHAAFRDFTVDTFIANPAGKTFYLLEGTKT